MGDHDGADPDAASVSDALLAEVALGLVQLAHLGRTTHVTRVAARTGVSQPTLSRAMARWERAAGVDLFARSGRDLVLTPAGERLADLARDAVQMIRRGVDDLRGARPEIALSVGLLRSLGPAIGSELVAAFHRTQPDVRLEQHEGGSAELVADLADGRLDLALLAPRPAGRCGWYSLGRQAFALVVPRGHRLGTGGPVDLADAADEPFLALHSRYSTRDAADALCAEAGFTARVVLETDDVASARTYVASGMGIAILPQDAMDYRRVVYRPIASERAWREIGLAWAPDARMSVAAQAFVETAAGLGRRYPGWADLTVDG